MTRNHPVKMSSVQDIEWVRGTTDDGRIYRVMISQIEVRRMIAKAQRNKGGRSVDGPVEVILSDR